MVQSLEQYIAEATNAYKPATTAIQTQLGALSGQLQTANDTINRNYARQQAELNSQRNQAAEAASIQAAGSGGSFGGMANLANRRYYDRSFVPAQAQMQTNQANELSQTRQSYENKRTDLNSQLSNLQAQIQQSALSRYYEAVEAEKQREAQRKLQEAQLAAQREAQAAQNAAWERMMQAQKNAAATPTYKNWDFGNGYSIQESPNGQATYLKNGTAISAGAWLGNTLGGAGRGGQVRWDLWNDIWNNGVRTNGVGSDTIDAINKARGNLGPQYNYLFR